VAAKLQAVRGMNDILPAEAERWISLEKRLTDWLRRYGYQNIRMPLVEPTALFLRAIGAATDIVEKEMYSWRDALNDEELTLRPEGTAGCVRAAIEHNLLYDGPKRLWYAGPMFRHERPQKGRYRQFHQLGVEALGWASPGIDAELIVMCASLWRELGVEGIRLELNCIGSAEERAAHRSALVGYFESRADSLDADARRRLHANPLRILDSKNPAMQDVISEAPLLAGFLGAESRRHDEEVRRLIAVAGVTFTDNPRLVRGLDYYNLTVFEWTTDRLGAQAAVCGGGRYDGLFAQLGGKPSPAAGFGLGLDRLVALLPEPANPGGDAGPTAYLAHQGDSAAMEAFLLAEELRRAGHSLVLHAGGGTLKAQMRKADTSGAPFALILGEDELAAASVTVKLLRQGGEQRRVARGALAAELSRLMLQSRND
jgi:histidyl-tRNA synthetase